MNTTFGPIVHEISILLAEWEEQLLRLPPGLIETKRNSQGRTIRQILGHLIDSASNNIHRTVHMQYHESPVEFPNYASHGNNDRWIAIQDYQAEDWHTMIMYWKYSNLHLIHVISRIQDSSLGQVWSAGDNRVIRLDDMVTDYLRHFRLHLGEIKALIG
jgi:hypothetical protein